LEDIIRGDKMKKIIKLLLLAAIVTSTTSASQARSHDQRVKDYLQAVESAKSKVKEFNEAIKSGNAARIKRVTLEIQEDPAAIKELNKQSVSVKKRFVKTINKIQAKTIKNIKKKYVKEYNAKHPDAKIKIKDVKVKKFTNPSSEIKGGHDWDVTVSVKGKDVPFREVEGMVHESYYDAAGGKKSYPNSNPKKFAKSHHVEVTDGISHAEAYEGGSKYINKNKKGKAEFRIKDPERFSKTIEHKSHLDQKNAADYADKREYSKSEVYKHEQARQYTKQYEEHIKPRIKEMGGRVPENVRKGTEILKKIGKPSKKLGRIYTPADADMDLAKRGKHGETMESIIKKGSSLVESGQKIKRPSRETRLNEKLRDANKAVKSAKESGNIKDLRKAQNKVARTKQELKQIESSKPVKNKSDKISESGSPKEGSLSAKQTETLKGKVGRIANEYVEGAIIWNQTQKAREGIKEGDSQKVKAAVLGEDTANRLEGGKEYISDTDKYEASKKEEVISTLTNKLTRMGATKEEIKSFRDNYGKDGRKTSQIIEQVKSRGGKDTAGHRPLDADGKMDDAMSKTDRAIEAAKQAGSYGKDVLDMASLGGVSRGEEAQNDLADSVKQADSVFVETENNVLGKIYTELRDRGASKEEARAALKNYRNDKSGVRELVANLKERDPQKAKGSGRKKDGLSVDNVDIEKDDDGWLSRAEESFVNAGKSVKEMLYDSPKKFLDDTAKDLRDIKKGLTEKSKLEKYIEEKRKEMKSQYDRKYNKLRKLGATDIEAAKALAGKHDSVNKLTKKLREEKKIAKAKAARKKLEEKLAQSKKEELAKKAKALMEQAEKADKEAETKAKAARKRLEEKIAQSKKEELSDKAKALIAQADQVDEEAETEAKAARKRLEEKIAQSKKEELSDKAKALIAQADQTDKEAEVETKAASQRLGQKSSYRDMSSAERHQALKNNNNKSWEGLTEQLVKDLALTQDEEEKIAQLSGVISGGWSGKDKDGWKAKGSFKMHISGSGRVKGKYSGDASGSLRGFINSSGRMDIKLGGGSVHGGRWSGSIKKTESGGLIGSGSWNAEGYHGGWRGSGR